MSMRFLVEKTSGYIVGLGLILANYGCDPIVKDADQTLRIEALIKFTRDRELDLSQYDFVLIEGKIKCGGCAALWQEILPTSNILMQPSLVILGDSLPHDHCLQNASSVVVTDFESIEKAFPYIANYFVFYIENGKPLKYIELGARPVDI